MADGECVGLDPDLWFPGKGHGGPHNGEARAACRRCPVQVQCLNYALDNGEKYGMWGGATEKERRGMRSSNSKKGLLVRVGVASPGLLPRQGEAK